MESRGNANFPSSSGGGVESFGSTLHFGPDYNSDAFNKTHSVYSLANGTFNDAFHTFGLVWTEDRIYTYVDNETNIGKLLLLGFIRFYFIKKKKKK